ncbi:MAG: hypothetical protein Q9181_008064, partial [Wetmoreana brouardii]
NASESGSSHKRWVTKYSTTAGSSSREGENEANGEVFEMLDNDDVLGPYSDLPNRGILFWRNAPTEYSDRKIVTSPVDDVFGQFAEKALFGGNHVVDKPRIITGVPFEFVLGDPASAAIYRIILGDGRPAAENLSAEDIRTALAQPSMEISQNGLITQLNKVLCTIVNLCRHLGEVTIAMTLTSVKLCHAKWMTQAAFIEPLELDLAQSFACIVMLESGTVNIASSGLQKIMAMSSGDSLYIATLLLSDPACKWDSKITRIRGNIGRAGIALLIPPEEPRVRDIDPMEWNLVNHDEFDGVITDSFKSTSLHMSFTEFVLPIDTGLRGTRDTEIYLLETMISVHDGGRWMGDLKILPVFDDRSLRIIDSACDHIQKADVPFEEELTSVDSWYEFFDRPEGPIVFRAHGNWMARLAAASMSVVKGHLTLLFADNVCWTCGEIERHQCLAHQKSTFIL